MLERAIEVTKSRGEAMVTALAYAFPGITPSRFFSIL